MALTFEQAYPVLYKGWDRTAAAADFAATGGVNKAGYEQLVGLVPSQTFTPESAISRLKETSGQAISTLQAGADPLKQRYEDLIESIKGTAEQETKRADILSAQELARRGIPTSSTFAGEFQQERRLPVQTAFQAQEAAAGLSAEQAQQNIREAVSKIQSAQGINEVNAALEFYRTAEQSRQFGEQQALQERQFGLTEELARQPNTQVVQAGGRVLLIDVLSGRTIADLGSSTTGTGAEVPSWLQGILGGQAGITEPKPTFKPSAPTSGPAGGFGITTLGNA